VRGGDVVELPISFAAAQPVLDQYRAELFARWAFNVGPLEHE